MQKSVTFPDKSAVIPHFYISPGTGIKRSSSRRRGKKLREERQGEGKTERHKRKKWKAVIPVSDISPRIC